MKPLRFFEDTGAFDVYEIEHMATVDKDINESSEKIDEVKRIVQGHALALEYKKQIPQTPLTEGA